MTQSKQHPRFMVLIGGGISELYDAKHDLTFKQAVQAWVRGQVVCPTDCQMVLLGEDDCDGSLEQEQKEAETINTLIAGHRSWVEQELMKQNVYNLRMLDHDASFPNCHPFSRG